MSSSAPLFQKMEHPAGVAFTVTNPLIDYWLACWNGTDPLLDIGCGSCHNSMKAVASGVQVYATEVNENSLATLKQEYADKSGLLSFHLATLPNDIPLPDASFSGILCSEVFHFLNHEEVLDSIKRLHDLLIPGGKVILTCCSEDIEVFKPIKLKQIKEESRRQAPDRLDPVFNFLDFLDAALSLYEPDHKAWAFRELHRSVQPRTFFNFLNPEQLAAAFTNGGFIVDLVCCGPARHYPLWEHGDYDQIRLVATKPSMSRN